MNSENAQSIFKKRRKINLVLFAIFTILLAFYIIIFLKEYKTQQNYNFNISSPNKIIINQTQQTNNTEIVLKKNKDTWVITKPYKNKASFAIINSIIGNLNSGCSEKYSSSDIKTEYFATIQISSEKYNKLFHIGELNPSSDKVFIKENNTVKLCDKVLASIALAPAINFIDRRLFIGELVSIKSEFKEITNSNIINSIDFSVIGIAKTSNKNIKNEFIGKITFKTKLNNKVSTNSYDVIIDSDSQQILLVKQDIIYAISNNKELNNLMGL